MIDLETIASIIDKAAFDLTRDRRKPGYNRSPKDTERRRRVALAKAQRIMDAMREPAVIPAPFQTQLCYNARDAMLGVQSQVPYRQDYMPDTDERQ